MATFNRPDGPYPLHDTSDSNSTNLPGIYALQGYPPNSVADPGDVNAKLGSNGRWQRYHDRGTFKIEDIALSSTAFRLGLQHLTYAIGPIAGATTPTSEPDYCIRGQRIEFDSTFVEQAGLSPIAWTPNRKTWIYCNQAGTIIVDVQPLATPASPPTGYFTVVGVETDVANVVAIDTSSSPAYDRRAAPSAWRCRLGQANDTSWRAVIPWRNGVGCPFKRCTATATAYGGTCVRIPMPLAHTASTGSGRTEILDSSRRESARARR